MSNNTKRKGNSPLVEQSGITNLIENPIELDGWGIVVTNWDISKSQKERVKNRARIERPEGVCDVYSDWRDQADKFPSRCIGIHLYKSRNMDVRALDFRGVGKDVAIDDKDHGKCLFAYKLGWRENIKSIKAVEFSRDCRVGNLVDYWRKRGEGKIYATVKEFVKDLKMRG